MESNNRNSNWAWAICVLLLLATMLNYMDRQALSVQMPTLKAQYGLTESRIGMLEGCFGYSFAFGSIFFGWLADRMGPKFLYPLVLAGWSLAGVATALAGQEWLMHYVEQQPIIAYLEGSTETEGTGVYYWLLACRIILGACEAGHWPCALLTIRAILEAKDRTLGNGILQSGSSLGAITIPLYIQLAEQAGQSWEFAFWTIGIAGLLWVPCWFYFIRGLDLKVIKDSSSSETSVPVTESFSRLVRKAIVAGIVVCTLVISWQFLRAWLVMYLEDFHGYSKGKTRLITSGYFIIADVGCLLAGVYVAKMAKAGWSVDFSRKTGYLIFTILAAAGAAAPYLGGGWLMVASLYIAAAGILGLHPFYYALAQDISAKRMGMLSGALASFAWVISGWFQINVGKHIELEKSYHLGFLIAGLLPVIGMIAILFWPKTEQKADQITNA